MKYSALIGNPVEHSISPVLFGLLAEKVGLEYAHLKIAVPSTKKLEMVYEGVKNLKFSGLNITLPYKIETIKFLDKADNTVIESGAVNTIKVKANKFLGYNTDCIGFSETCKNLLKPIQQNDKVFVFGAGGAARAIISQVVKHTNNIFVFGRDQNQLERLKKDFNNQILDYHFSKDIIRKKIIEENPNYYINATPLGMIPNYDSSPIPSDFFQYISSNSYFLDAVFNPYKTKFLKDAEEIGAKVAPGIYWMIYQGCVAFNIWNDTNISLSQKDVSSIAKLLIERLQK